MRIHASNEREKEIVKQNIKKHQPSYHQHPARPCRGITDSLPACQCHTLAELLQPYSSVAAAVVVVVAAAAFAAAVAAAVASTGEGR